jgi:hypothetical protein
VAGRADQAAAFERLDEAGRGGGVVRERLLDEGGNAGFGEGQADRFVVSGRADDYGVVEPVLEQLLDGGD